MFKSLALTSVFLGSMITSLYASPYEIDINGAHASINFEASHLGFSVLTGRFDRFNGTFEYDSETPQSGHVSVEIDIGSVNSNHAERDNHLRGEGFFDVANYPSANFVSTGVKMVDETHAILSGNLTIRGITKPVDLETSFIGEGDDPWGGYRAGFSAETTILLGDFGMDGVIGNAPIRVIIHVEGIRQ